MFVSYCFLSVVTISPVMAQQSNPQPSDSIYFVMVDRFFDGDSEQGGPLSPEDPQGWHGGDLSGLLQKIDYIAEMGFGAVWLTPLFDSRDEPFGEWGAFHGYWVDSLTSLEPRFGDYDDLMALSEAMHSRGMRLIVDVVYNHTSFDSPLLVEHPSWFHDPAPIVDWDSVEERRENQVHGLPDLDQTNPEVSEYLIQSTVELIQNGGVDALRIDAVRHMDPSAISDILAAVDQRVGHHVEAVGEIFDGSFSSLKEEWRQGGFDAVYNFPLYYATVDALCDGAHMGRLASALVETARVGGELGRLVNFLDNHDLPRIRGRCSPETVDIALTTLFASPGTPMVTWGTESAMEGEHEPYNRGDMVFASAAQRELLTNLNRLRVENSALIHGDLSILELSEAHIVAARRAGESVALLAVNLAEESLRFALPRGLSGVSWDSGGGSISEDGLVVGASSAILVTGIGQPYQPPPVEMRVVRLQLSSRFLANNERSAPSHISGSGDIFGGWDPSEAIPITEGVLELNAPVGEVLEFKLLTKDGGLLMWETGANRYLLVESGIGDLVVDLE